VTTSRAALAIALAAAATLVWEVLLTRVSALRLAFHFSFLVVSNALFAVGVAGVVLTVARARTAGNERLWAARACAALAASLPLTYAFLLEWEVPAQFRLSDVSSSLGLAAFNAVAAVPFLFGGAAIGLLLQASAARVHRVYAADLLGAALGCIATPFVLWGAGAGGALAASVALALLATAALSRDGGRGRIAAAALAALTLAAAPFLDARYPVPSKTELQITAETSFIAGDERLSSRWSALSRVDVDRIPDDERSLFLRTPGVPMPRPERQAFLMQDGSAGTYIHDYTGTPEALDGLRRSLYALGATVFEPDSVFIIGAGGGDDLWAHKASGTGRIKAIELNRAIIDVHEGLLADWSRDLLETPGVDLVHGEGRSMLLAETERFDMLQMSGIDTWTALQSGAYMLAENFLYTRDAVRDMFGVVDEDGAVQVTRFSGDKEALRLLATFREVHAEVGEGEFRRSVACVPAGSFLSVLAKRTPFTDDEVRRLDAFLERAGVPAVVHPRQPGIGALDAFVRSETPDRFITEYPFDIRPVGDDRPYFFHFHRWNDLGLARRSIDAPTTVTQGNPLFLLGQLAFAAVLAALLLAPALRSALSGPGGGGADAPPRGALALSALGYFGGIGAGYVVLQVALLQKLVLLVGHPLHSLTVTLFTMLLGTGAGAFLSRRAFSGDAPARRLWAVPIGLAAVTAGLALGSEDLFAWAIPRSDAIRFAIAAGIVAPIGLLLGIPFAHGIEAVERHTPALVPWAWAANAATTVVGSIVAVVVSINFGFDAVFGLGVALYAIAASQAPGLAVRRALPPNGAPPPAHTSP